MYVKYNETLSEIMILNHFIHLHSVQKSVYLCFYKVPVDVFTQWKIDDE